jgi:hypothetical protein
MALKLAGVELSLLTGSLESGAISKGLDENLLSRRFVS